jgi:glycerophosphoryl diester phosphodiesterase
VRPTVLQAFESVKQGGRLLLVGHRGSGKTGPENRIDTSLPIENTLESFALALNNGAQMLEFDVSLSQDNTAIIFHDDDTQRLFPHIKPPKLITEMTVEQIKALQGGPKIPSLEDLYQQKWETLYYTELKCPSDTKLATRVYKEQLVKQNLELIKKYDLLAYSLIVSFDYEILSIVADLYPEALLGFNCYQELPKQSDFLRERCLALCPDVDTFLEAINDYSEAATQNDVVLLPYGSNRLLKNNKARSLVSGLTTDSLPEAKKYLAGK